MKTNFSKYFLTGSLFLSVAATTVSCQRGPAGPHPTAVTVEAGVSKRLAEARKRAISNLAYRLALDIPARKQDPIQASETITFDLTDPKQSLPLDFKEKPENVAQLTVNQKPVPVEWVNEHLMLPARFLKKGPNTVEVRFVAGNLSLNRNKDFLYTLLVPDRARTVFPCFDQPDLKATFALTLTLPRDWSAIANGAVEEETISGNRKTLRFRQSDLISTYLFSFAAGRFHSIVREDSKRAMRFLHRETDASKLKESQSHIFQHHQDALRFLEQYTQIPYPFQKFDFVAIPDFQYGGMEHVGAIQYKASTLFLDQGATQDQQIARASLIAHETAHMWFGDLVTMPWFNDVWMKEVFANFMADKITQQTLRHANYDLKFLIDHLPAAYSVDRTAGANPIRQELDNLQDAGSMYGNIIYHKAPVMMRQLEQLMGEEPFRKGVQDYLKKYAFGNATWPQLIEILDQYTPADLQAWNQVWVNEPGRPVIDYSLQTNGGKIERLVLTQQAEDGSDRLWPQFFTLILVYPDRTREIPVNLNARQVTLQEVAGEAAPQYVVFNTKGQGYGVFPVDARGTSALFSLKDPVVRASAYINLYENMLNGRSMEPGQLLALYRGGLQQETEELNLKLLTGQLSDIFWRLLRPTEKLQLAPALEQELWTALERNPDANSKKLLFKTYQSIALTKAAQDRLYQIWDKEQPPQNVTLTEEDYTSLALALAVRDYAAPTPVLAKQRTRIQNPDRKQRMEFLMPALSPEAAVRDAFFASLQKEENREKEAWVVTALGYLHHPLRAATSEQYLPASLELLQEIQLTGDIFFPYNWLSATLGAYQSPSAAQTVRTFLQQHPAYNPKLKAKILQAADPLFRAEKLVGSAK
ncbi:M1 family metallopeptidase [Rufibacter psychrotolerans]|uniref:M1 family metallopeptidase n=1 Tax=Rufibacter psychrotolerans TaxID=2812556 RepID=UPI001967CE05|nr:M1 family aminopeptidase [Rufibacter sp. SYSU D00308]